MTTSIEDLPENVKNLINTDCFEVLIWKNAMIVRKKHLIEVAPAAREQDER
jgi:hypothetical protein